MTLPASGPISLKDIQTEFGGPAAPIALSSYYRNGAYVTGNVYAPNVPTSGAVSLSNFYGAKKLTLQTVLLTSSQTWVAPTTLVGTVKATLIGGGGGGGTGGGGAVGAGGGGGAGGVVQLTGVSLTPGASYPAVIGCAGAAAGGYPATGGRGGNTTFLGYTAYGGGYGGCVYGNGGSSIASGGGGGGSGDTGARPGGTGGAQGHNGASVGGRTGGASDTGSAGGGAGGAPCSNISCPCCYTGYVGGIGVYCSLLGAYVAGGGARGSHCSGVSAGGTGGGGNTGAPATYYGGGGGGGGVGGSYGAPGAGYRGVVVIQGYW